MTNNQTPLQGRLLKTPWRLVFPATLFAAIAVAQLSPVNPLRQIPAGTETTATVPTFNLWTLSRNTDYPFSGQDYWDAKFFFPQRSTFALSETQPNLLLLTPVARLVSPVFAYNCAVFLQLTLNGLAGYHFSRSNFRSGRVASIACGLLLQLLPFVNLQLGVLQLIPIWPSLAVLHFTQKLAEHGQKKDAIATGLSLGITYIHCNNYGLMMALIAALVFGPVLMSRHRLREWIANSAIAATCCLALILPVVVEQLSVLQTPEFQRASDTVASLSAQFGDLLTNPWNDRLSLPNVFSSRDRPLWGLSCGLVTSAFAMFGIFFGLMDTQSRRWTASLTAIAIVSLTLAILPGSGDAGKSIHETLCRVVPGLAQIRSVYRFVVFFQIATVGLTVVFLTTCEKRLQLVATDLFRIKKSHILPTLLTVFLTSCCLLEIYPEPTYVCSPPWQQDQPFCKWLRENTEPGSAVACFPFPGGTETNDYEHEVAWMLAARFHQRPIVNGYSGFFPPNYVSLKDHATWPPNDSTLQTLKSMQVRYLLMKSNWDSNRRPHDQEPPDVNALESNATEVYFDQNNDIRIYRLN